MAKSAAALALIFVVGALIALQDDTNITRQINSPSTLRSQTLSVQVESHIYDLFVRWTQEHGKLYGSANEKNYRLGVFRQNVLKIQRHQTLGKSYTLAINQFADLTAEEFKAKYLTLKAPSQSRVLNVAHLNTSSIPASVDHRNEGIVGPVKDQGQCGSCWGFSAVAALEGLNAQKNGQYIAFSEQELVDCSTEEGNEGCNGGLMDYAFQYVEQFGIGTQAQYPYRARDQKCKRPEGTPTFKISGYIDVPPQDNDQLLAALAQQVVSVAIEADTEVFQFYDSGIIDDDSCGTELDHGVAAVGYGSENGKDFWIVRNSWGSSWGDKGYVKILRQKGKGDGICGIALAASYPTL